MINYNYIVFDCETGGLSPKRNPITEIALIACEFGTFKEINRFETFVRPYADLVIEEKALEMTNITLKEINQGIDYKELVKLLIQFFQLSTPRGGKGNRFYPILVGHNVSFDIGFVKEIFQFAGRNLHDYVASNNEEVDRICTLKLSKAKWIDNGKYNLEACCKRAGITLTDSHRAMADVAATKKLVEILLKPVIKNAKGEVEEETNGVQEFRKQFEI